MSKPQTQSLMNLLRVIAAILVAGGVLMLLYGARELGPGAFFGLGLFIFILGEVWRVRHQDPVEEPDDNPIKDT